jgi:hypothetical protein
MKAIAFAPATVSATGDQGKRTNELATASMALLLGALYLNSFPETTYAADYKVYSPHVELYESELEYRGFDTLDSNPAKNGVQAHRFSISHAFTDFWSTEVYGVFAKAAGDSLDAETIEWENKFQLTPQGKYWADFGLLAEAEFPIEDEEAYEFKIGPLIEKQFGRSVATVNLSVERQFGKHRETGTIFSYAARWRYRLMPMFEPAVELYGEPGAVGSFGPTDLQRHQLGPAAYGKVRFGGRNALKYSAAVLRGLTSGSPDWTFVARLEYEFY